MISEGTHHELFQKLNLTPSISITRDLGQTAEVTGGERGLLVLIGALRGLLCEVFSL